MSRIDSTATDQAVPADLISFLKAIPDGRYRRGVRYPQWFLLLVAVLGILSGCRSSRDLEAFAKRHREALNQALGLDFKREPVEARVNRCRRSAGKPVPGKVAKQRRPCGPVQTYHEVVGVGTGSLR